MRRDFLRVCRDFLGIVQVLLFVWVHQQVKQGHQQCTDAHGVTKVTSTHCSSLICERTSRGLHRITLLLTRADRGFISHQLALFFRIRS